MAFPKGVIVFTDRSYQGRVNIFTQNNSLSINKLTVKDAGSYQAQINQVSSNVTRNEEFTLHIYEQLQEPQVTVKSMTVSENASCNITLICSMERAGEDVLYSWTSRDPHASESWGGSTLTISWLPCDPDLSITCTAKNPVSQSSSRPIHTWQFCTDLGASRGGPMGETVAGILGESITLPLALPDSQDIQKVVWMFNTTIISKKRGQEATVNQLIKFKDPDKNTMQISSQDYSLKIGQLKMEDAGPYHAYVCSNSRIISTERIILIIYRSAPDFSSSQAEAPADIPEPTASHTGYIKLSHGHEKLNTCTTTARQQPRHISKGCSDSSGTTVEDKERTEMGQPVNGKDQTCDMAPALVAEGETIQSCILDD
ncbi:T-lymphocyte surface antigen Ly-9 [Camelus ferus]|nr:T-lymphocyte surface antigen Ly-9 [Camelus ferus]